MDAIDEALLDAWNRLSPILRKDRAEAAARAARATSGSHSRPLRAWCLCIRASDTRIEDVGMFDGSPETKESHMVFLSAPALRKLCAPVMIDWPGIRWTQAAARLGLHSNTLRSWVKHGAFEVRHQPALTVGELGQPVPFIWNPTPLDPNADLGRGPGAHWGTLWQSLHQQITKRFALVVRRAPRLRGDARDSVSGEGRGARVWLFECPGLQPAGRARPARAGGVLEAPKTTCGRKVARLYLPRPAWTILHATDPALAAALPAGADCWACARCHRIRYDSLIAHDGWNVFVSCITGGLLYGSEVARPRDLVAVRKKRHHVLAATVRRREKIVALLALGRSVMQVGAELGIPQRTVACHIGAIYRQHNVSGRAELFARLNLALPRKANDPTEAIMSCIREGLLLKQIPGRVGKSAAAVRWWIDKISRERGVRGLRGLRELGGGAARQVARG